MDALYALAAAAQAARDRGRRARDRLAAGRAATSARSAISSRSASIRTRTSRRSRAARSWCNDAAEARARRGAALPRHRAPARRHARRRVSRRQVQPARRQCAHRRRAARAAARVPRPPPRAGRALFRALSRPIPPACCRRARRDDDGQSWNMFCVLLPLDRLHAHRAPDSATRWRRAASPPASRTRRCTCPRSAGASAIIAATCRTPNGSPTRP